MEVKISTILFHNFFFQSQNRVLIIFESPQSFRSQFQVTLERSQFGLSDLLLEDTKLRNPYNLQVTIPSKILQI